MVRLRINAGRYKDGVSSRGLDGVGRLLERLARHDPVDVGQNGLECRLDVRGVQRRSLDKRQSILRYSQICQSPASRRGPPETGRRRTCKGLGLVRGHRPEVLEIALVTDEHDDDVRVCVVAELLEPARDVRVRLMLRDVVHEQGADRAAVVRRCDRPVAFLARWRCAGVPRSAYSRTRCRGRRRTGIPNLRLHRLAVDSQRPCRKLDTDR